jgi:hypothetical protein
MTASVARNSVPLGVAFSVAVWLGCANAGDAPQEVDASFEAECPTGWYCARESANDAEQVAAPAPVRHYPVTSLIARVGWIPMPDEASRDAWLLGGGFSLQQRPGRTLALEIGPEGFFGRDFLGRERRELGLAASLVLLGYGVSGPGPFVAFGPNLAFAQLDGFEGTVAHAGGHLGFGGAWPIAERARLLLQLDVFVRGRIDAAGEPEYRDPLTGSPGNGDAGATLRLGVGFDVVRPTPAVSAP